MLYFSQRAFMYHPDKGDEAFFLARASAHRVLPWRDGNGNLIGWKRPNPAAKKRMLILHGNGGSALSRTVLADGFEKSGDWEFYLFEYPGYGWREGAPSEKAILDSAQAALNELASENETPLFITGESLGSGVACLLAARQPDAVRGLFLITPYTSITDIATGRFPFFPVRFLMHDRYEAAVALREYSGPVAVLLAGRDTIVPTRFGQALFDSYNGPKKLWIQPDAGHNSLDFSPDLELWREVEQFWNGRTPQNVR